MEWLQSRQLDQLTYANKYIHEGFPLTRVRWSLYHHQIADVVAMSNLERQMEFSNDDGHVIQSNVARLEEPFGSGKTISTLTLIAEVPNVNIRTIHSTINTEHGVVSLTTKVRDECVLSLNIIFCAKSSSHQWINEISNNTDLKCFVVNNSNTVNQFNELVKSGEIQEYDVAVVSFCMIHAERLDIGDLEYSQFPATHSMNAIYDIARNCGVVFSRVFIDDYDTLRLPTNNISAVPALITWLISATDKPVDTLQQQRYEDYGSVVSALNHWHGNIRRIDANRVIRQGPYSITCETSFTSAQIHAGCPHLIVNIVNDPNSMVNSFISEFGQTDVSEAIAAHAIIAGAQKLNIHVNTTAELFQRMLGMEYDTITNTREHVFILQANLNVVMMGDLPIGTPAYSNEYLGTERITYTYDDLCDQLQVELQTARDTIKTSQSIVCRVKDNIKQNICVICMSSLSHENISIQKCCNFMMHFECLLDHIKVSGTQRGGYRCPNCRGICDLQTSVVILDEGFDLSAITDERQDYTAPEIETVIHRVLDKFQTLMAIVQGEEVISSRSDVQIQKIMSDEHELPIPDQEKILIFTNYGETCDQIYELLDDNGIGYIALHQVDDIEASISAFQEGNIHVMLINAQYICAGLNLQFATKIIFFNRFISQEVEAQCIGRAQRFGRTNRLDVHWIVYENEAP
jgi:hypothetical protein